MSQTMQHINLSSSSDSEEEVRKLEGGPDVGATATFLLLQRHTVRGTEEPFFVFYYLGGDSEVRGREVQERVREIYGTMFSIYRILLKMGDVMYVPTRVVTTSFAKSDLLRTIDGAHAWVVVSSEPEGVQMELLLHNLTVCTQQSAVELYLMAVSAWVSLALVSVARIGRDTMTTLQECNAWLERKLQDVAEDEAVAAEEEAAEEEAENEVEEAAAAPKKSSRKAAARGSHSAGRRKHARK